MQQTGIGKTVSALKKKYGDSDIGAVSRDLVVKWKQMVAREEEERENEEAENGGDEVVLETKVIQMFPKISQSRRRPLLGPSPG